jgi:uncharacterized protein YbjT (DUF2867 family)
VSVIETKPGTRHAQGAVLLTGATGFVGRSLGPALVEAGYTVHGLTRDAEKARRRWPERSWRQGDLGGTGDLAPLMEGCEAAFYLVHDMRGGEPGYRQREVAQAERFATAAAKAGLRRVVYLGGVAPAEEPSEHLRSRLEVGEALRAGPVPTLELRASMIVGAGSLSWIIVRDLAARLPLMVLPRWLRSMTEPVAIADVLVALRAGLEVPLDGRAVYDIPGPDRLTGRSILEATARAMGLRRPAVVEVPLLTPWLSAQWVRLITRADWDVARELVLGLSGDLLSKDARYWALIRHYRREPFWTAARTALAVEERRPQVAGVGALAERAVRAVSAVRW